jgi:PAS domain S-box-containing protein
MSNAIPPRKDDTVSLERDVAWTKDIAERLIAINKRLQGMEREDEVEAALETAGDAIIVADYAGVIVQANKAAEGLLKANGTLVGRPITSIMPERYRAMHLHGFARYQATRVPTLIGKVVKVNALRGDGTEQPVILSLTSHMVNQQERFVAIIRAADVQIIEL